MTILQKFRRWQRQPFSYSLQTEEKQHCRNCNHTFVGNFCPYCGQKAGTGRITWTSMWQNILEPWGMHSKSYPFTLLQLYLRPGYLMGDYLDGRRQYASSPVNTFFITALLFTLLGLAFMPNALEPEALEGVSDTWLGHGFNWMAAHDNDWGLLFMGVLMIPFTWLFFRNSPRHTRHTLPEGFFVQVMALTALTPLNFLPDLFDLLGWDQSFLWGMIPLYYVCAYRQLFGYSWLSTLWRTTLSLACFFILFVLLCIMATT